MKNKQLILTAKAFSVLFAPHYFPLVCLLILMGFSYMRIFPLGYKLVVLAIVFFFTILVPRVLIKLYRRLMGWRHHQLSRREARTIPYFISILCYIVCYYTMTSFIVPHFVVSVVLAALFVQLICLVINNWHKISVHSAAAGAMNGALIAFSLIFNFNALWWLCLTVLISGCVGTSRLVLRRHTLKEVNLGLSVGFLTGLVSILML